MNLVYARVGWRVLSTGFISNGSYLDSETVKEWVKNKKWDTTMEYWIEYKYIEDR